MALRGGEGGKGRPVLFTSSTSSFYKKVLCGQAQEALEQFKESLQMEQSLMFEFMSAFYNNVSISGP